MNIEKRENEIEVLLNKITIQESKYIDGKNYLAILKKYLKHRMKFFDDYKEDKKNG